MEAKAAAEREESRRREIAAIQLGEHRVSEVTNTARKDESLLKQQHAERLQVEQEKAAALVAAANERAREAEAAATKRTQENQTAANEREEKLRADRDKTLQDFLDDKNKRIEQAVLYYVFAQVQSR